MSELVKLVLSNNLFQNFTWSRELDHIKYVDLRRNRITLFKFSSTLNEHFKPATLFDLRNNELTSFKVECTEALSNNRTFYIFLDDNKFHCDLSFHNLIFENRKCHQIKIAFGKSKCFQPKSMSEIEVAYLESKDLSCSVVNYFSICKCTEASLGGMLVNCSYLSLRNPPDLNHDEIAFTDNFQVDRIEFNFANNFLKSLPDVPKKYKIAVSQIDASNNSIVDIGVNNFHDATEMLDLRNNELIFLKAEVLEKLRITKKVFLGGNPWLCDCSTIDFFETIKSMKPVIGDYEQVYCANLGEKFDDISSYKVCFNWPLVSISGTVLGLFGAIFGLFYKFKKDIKIFLHAHNMCLWFANEKELDEDKIYDAFVCFATPDQAVVEDIIMELENVMNGFKCLVGVRDWPPGQMFPELVRKLKWY